MWKNLFEVFRDGVDLALSIGALYFPLNVQSFTLYW